MSGRITSSIEENWPKGPKPRKEVSLSNALHAVLVKNNGGPATRKVAAVEQEHNEET
jgi:hypothetical protein